MARLSLRLGLVRKKLFGMENSLFLFVLFAFLFYVGDDEVYNAV